MFSVYKDMLDRLQFTLSRMAPWVFSGAHLLLWCPHQSLSIELLVLGPNICVPKLSMVTFPPISHHLFCLEPQFPPGLLELGRGLLPSLPTTVLIFIFIIFFFSFPSFFLNRLWLCNLDWPRTCNIAWPPPLDFPVSASSGAGTL